jgi:hypothetical protein
MAKLIIQTDGAPDRVLELRLGSHKVGRAPENDIVLLHPSVSSRHCIMELSEEGLMVQDLGSTNGTDLDGQPIVEASAQSGQVIGIGVFDCVVEGVTPRVSIPKWGETRPPRLPPGVKACSNHPEFPASMECSHCHRLFCGVCVHLMQRQGGSLHKLCPVCSHHCKPIAGMNQPATPNKLFGLLKKMIPKSGTMRLRRGRRRFR